MSATVIHGEGLGKEYRRGLQAHDGLCHSIEAFVRSPISSLRKKKDETFTDGSVSGPATLTTQDSRSLG